MATIEIPLYKVERSKRSVGKENQTHSSIRPSSTHCVPARFQALYKGPDESKNRRMRSFLLSRSSDSN
jgi:hypothetical protein